MAANAIIKFLEAARSLANQGMSKEAIEQFARNEFGEITELFQKQINNIFKPKKGIENIKIKDEVFDDTVVELPYDDQLQPFNPKNPLKQYGKPKQNRPDVFGIDDYDTTNMSEIKKQIIRTETKLGNLNPDAPDFQERAKILIDELDDLQVKMKNDKPRTDKYTGGMVEVEPNLSDIGHGSDALMARTRLVAPNSQATTSTGLNYLLAEDNDNIRVPFKVGGDAGRRAFLKLLATLTGGAAAFKTGILGLGEGTAKKAVTETVKQSAGSGTPPPYFFRLVEKIKFMGDDTLASQDKTIAKKYKDYVMEEDFAGNIQIIKKDMDNPYPEEVIMSYKVDDVALKNKKGFAKAEEYEEFTARPDGDGKMKDIEQGVPDEVIDEAGDTTAMTLKEKADGGRINFRIGGSPRKFLEKVFGKDKFKNMIENDPELEQGMLEVVEMFRNRDKEGLKMYLQKFLPHMDDATIEDFIVGSGDISGIEGQLLRLGSGRDYAGKIEMMKKADNMRKLDSLDVTEEMIRKPNAEGGRIGLFLGGGLTAGKGQLKKILEYMAKGSSHGKTGSEILQMLNPKQFNKMLNDPSIAGKFSAEIPEGVAGLIQNYIKQMKTDRANMVGDIIGTGRKMKKVDDDIVTYKIKIVEDMISKGVDRKMAEEMAETMAQVVSKQAGKKATPKITDEGLLEMENIQKNLITKDRKLQAAGGLTTMLGE